MPLPLWKREKGKKNLPHPPLVVIGPLTRFPRSSFSYCSFNKGLLSFLLFRCGPYAFRLHTHRHDTHQSAGSVAPVCWAPPFFFVFRADVCWVWCRTKQLSHVVCLFPGWMYNAAICIPSAETGSLVYRKEETCGGTGQRPKNNH